MSVRFRDSKPNHDYSSGEDVGLVATIGLRQNVFDDVAVDVGEAEVSAVVFVSQLFVIESKQVKNRGV